MDATCEHREKLELELLRERQQRGDNSHAQVVQLRRLELQSSLTPEQREHFQKKRRAKQREQDAKDALSTDSEEKARASKSLAKMREIDEALERRCEQRGDSNSDDLGFDPGWQDSENEDGDSPSDHAPTAEEKARYEKWLAARASRAATAVTVPAPATPAPGTGASERRSPSKRRQRGARRRGGSGASSGANSDKQDSH